MKRLFFLLSTIIILFGCNGNKKQAAYECEDYLNKAYEALDDGYYQVTQARRDPNLYNARNFLDRAERCFDDASSYAKKAADIASDYDYDVESFAKKASSHANDASNYARKAASTNENYEIDRYTQSSQSCASDGQKDIKDAKVGDELQTELKNGILISKIVEVKENGK